MDVMIDNTDIPENIPVFVSRITVWPAQRNLEKFKTLPVLIIWAMGAWARQHACKYLKPSACSREKHSSSTIVVITVGISIVIREDEVFQFD
ncbi:hypothetical protein PAXRUDRAFT_289317 [Paxillus rubicundulus Ve08.2h10]|uniref:Uncharacterized protein n=1 Tax=Paxillus rubicundulus Ve08.2h10 TaxID=930991 RepID=A0A0D0DLK4_9AGAM|nr:hypothetical protein PAXRUDRAFT_289317 [Paxillus rubicundulus Ve08.2h10]